MIKVDKNVPLPVGEKRGAKPKYPWAKMEVGDSFFVEGVSGSRRGMFYNLAKRHFGATGHIQCSEEGSGVRVWRVK